MFKRRKLPLIIEIWIFNDSGLSLLNIKNSLCPEKSKVDPLLFSGILAAMEYISEESLHNITMNNSQLCILPITEPFPLFFVALTSNKVKHKRVRAQLIEIYDAFWCEFKEILPSWSGNVSIFNYFKAHITENYFCT
ncbi:MAG: hypothetical protein ACTSRK_00755 [Promethearchaeota archaeon]